MLRVNVATAAPAAVARLALRIRSGQVRGMQMHDLPALGPMAQDQGTATEDAGIVEVKGNTCALAHIAHAADTQVEGL